MNQEVVLNQRDIVRLGSLDADTKNKCISILLRIVEHCGLTLFNGFVLEIRNNFFNFSDDPLSIHSLRRSKFEILAKINQGFMDKIERNEVFKVPNP